MTKIKRTKQQGKEEKSAFRKYIQLLKNDKRTEWEIVQNEGGYTFIISADLDTDTAGYADYGWVTGAFRYLEEAYSETGPFMKDGDDKIIRAYGLVRSKKVMTEEKWHNTLEKYMIDVSRELWEIYREDSTAENLRAVRYHCEQTMTEIESTSVSMEREACMRAVMGEGENNENN